MSPVTLDEGTLLAADAIGDVIEHWGFRKALGRTWTVLYLETEPLAAADLAERLQMSSGATSTTLTELQRWGVVRRVWKPGERREYFEAETDFWKMIAKVVSERERFLAESVRERLTRAETLLARRPRGRETDEVLDRIRRLTAFAGIAKAVIDSFITSRRADFTQFGNLLVLGDALQRGAKRKR